MIKPNSEDEIHRFAVAELRRKFHRLGFAPGAEPFFHCANERRANRAYGAKLKALGVSPGVPDLIIVWPTCTGAPGAAIELKTSKGRASKAQFAWLARYQAVGWFGEVLYGHTNTAERLHDLGYIDEDQLESWLDRVRR